MEAELFIDKLYTEAEKQGIREFQIKYSRETNSNMSAYEGKLDGLSNNESQSLLFSVRQNGKIGNYSVGVLDEKAIAKIVRSAKENAELISDEDDNFFHDGSGDYQEVQPYLPQQEKLAKLDKLGYLLEMEKAAYAASPLVNKVISTFYEEAEFDKIIRNSLGLNVHSHSVRAIGGIYLSVEKEGVIKDAEFSVDFAGDEDFNPQKPAQKAVAEALSRLGGVDFKSEKMPVVFRNKAFRAFVTKIAAAVSARAVIDKASCFEGKIGQMVADPVVTVIEDPFMKGQHGTRAFDEEGYPTSYKEVIKDGVLTTFLHSLKTAHKFGTAPTGNGSEHQLVVGNFYLKPGKTSFADLLCEMNRGILIEELEGLHVGFDLVSGNFSFVGIGFEVVDGKIGRPLNNFTVAGNFYEMLKNIRETADDLYFKRSAIGSPSVLIDHLTLASK